MEEQKMSSRFDKETNRRNTGCLKWNVAENELPMWVADMDFETAPEVTEALVERAKHGIFKTESCVPERKSGRWNEETERKYFGVSERK